MCRILPNRCNFSSDVRTRAAPETSFCACKETQLNNRVNTIAWRRIVTRIRCGTAGNGFAEFPSGRGVEGAASLAPVTRGRKPLRTAARDDGCGEAAAGDDRIEVDHRETRRPAKSTLAWRRVSCTVG